MSVRDIIVAQASATGPAGVALLRLSGPSLQDLARQLCGVRPQPRHAHLVTFRDGSGGALDQGLLLWFPAPHSYTGEDVLELHTHGGEVAPRRVLRACLALGARPAEPGEFTRRAFELGKLDLAQAEAVGDLIEANSEAAARGALRSLSGAFSQEVRAIQQDLTSLRVQAEGGLDFPEEELPLAALARQREQAQALMVRVRALLAEARRSRELRRGRQVVLLGAPNVGKSSLLNRLAGDDVAIVSPQAGTTRDAVRSQLELGGLRLEVIDTAGVREQAGEIEQLGIERTWAAVARADLVLRLWSCEASDAPPPGELPTGVPVLEVFNKCDLLAPGERDGWAARMQAVLALESQAPAVGVCTVSARTGEGIGELEHAVLAALDWHGEAEPGFLARERHLVALQEAAQALELALACAADELFAEELRRAQRALDGILGEFVADDLLGEIFARFCIGK